MVTGYSLHIRPSLDISGWSTVVKMQDVLSSVCADLDSESSYTFRVEAWNAIGSCESEDVTFSTLDAHPPGQATAVECSGAERFELGVLGWHEVTETNGKPVMFYNIEMQQAGGKV